MLLRLCIGPGTGLVRLAICLSWVVAVCPRLWANMCPFTTLLVDGRARGQYCGTPAALPRGAPSNGRCCLFGCAGTWGVGLALRG